MSIHTLACLQTHTCTYSRREIEGPIEHRGPGSDFRVSVWVTWRVCRGRLSEWWRTGRARRQTQRKTQRAWIIFDDLCWLWARMPIPHQLSSSPSDPGVVWEMVWFSVTDESVFLCSLIHASLFHHLHVLLKRLILCVFVRVLLLLSHLPFFCFNNTISSFREIMHSAHSHNTKPPVEIATGDAYWVDALCMIDTK